MDTTFEVQEADAAQFSAPHIITVVNKLKRDRMHKKRGKVEVW
jgi:hypothetical protein